MRAPLVFCCLLLAMAPSSSGPRESLLKDHLMVTMYGNPRSTLMGALGEQAGAARAARLTAQGAAYQAVTSTPVVMAYHLVATVAQCTAGNDGLWRRRETSDVIDALLADARAHGFRLILDVQPGRSTVAAEVQALVRYLKEPDVDLGLDPEFSMTECEVPGREIGQMRASDVNIALDILEREITSGSLPPKVLIVHQFRLDMLPDKANIRASRLVDVVLNMDGFGSQSLKLSSYRTVMKQPLPFAGIKLFYKQDVNLFSPAQVLALTPRPSVVIYQ